MEIIKNANLSEYRFSRGIFLKNREIYQAMDTLNINDVIEIGVDDLQGKINTPHSIICAYNARSKRQNTNKGFSLRTLEGKKNWLIIRTK